MSSHWWWAVGSVAVPVVLISRGTMSGGAALARCVAERLHMRSVSREDLVAIVDAKGDHAQSVMTSIDRAARAYEQFSQFRRPYLILMRYALLCFVREGDVVYHGYSGHLLLPGLPCCLRVRVNAPMEIRVRNAIHRLSLSEPEAREAVLREDDEHVRWARFMYGRDIREPNLYDVCVSVERMQIPSICTMVAGALQEPEFQLSAADRAAVQDRFLAASVEATLVCDPRTEGVEVAASASGGNVRLEGPYLEPERRAELLDVARAVRGVANIEYQPGCAPSFVLNP